MALNWDFQGGTAQRLQCQALNPDDSVPVNQFQATDALAAVLWQGSSDAPIWTKAGSPDVNWLDYVNAKFEIVVHSADTVSLSPGVYYIEATATRNADSAQLLPAGSTLTITAAPGTSTTRPTYCTIADLRRLAPAIDDITAPGNETGFAEQIADARSWLDESIVRNYGGGWINLLGEVGLAVNSYATGGARRSSLRNPWILQLLAQGPAVANANGGLIVTRRTLDVCAYYALSRIYDGLITKGGVYPALAARYKAQCYQLLMGYTAEISVAGQVDQWNQLLAQIPVNFGTARFLRV